MNLRSHIMANDGRSESEGKDHNYNWKEFIEKTPCARNSFLYGVVGGLVAGSGRFIFTKHIGKSCDLAVASFLLISLGNWGVCRYMTRKHKLEIEKTVELVTKYSNTKAKEQSDKK